MASAHPHVLIIGGGIAGLCLAQGMEKAGASFALYERDESPGVRSQGYRIGINTDGGQALHACVPENLFDLILETSTVPLTGRLIVFDPQLREQISRPLPAAARDVQAMLGAAVTTPLTAVHRQTLREVLLHGIQEKVHFGKSLTGFDQTKGGQVRAHYSDGTHAEGDILIGADGTRSLVRKLLLPEARVSTLGYAIYGKTPVELDTATWLPDNLLTGFSRIRAADGTSLATGAFRKRRSLEGAAAEYAPGLHLSPTQDYLMWTLSGSRLRASLRTRTPSELCALVSASLKDWHPALCRLIDQADAEATFLVELRSAEPVKQWCASSITLAGDAIHSMSPGRGEGANTALRDAELLCRNLRSAIAQKQPHVAAIAEYETEMLRYGFRAVSNSRLFPFMRDGPAR
jgi:2-polyprenyl-6-methoxyphenol hydroxylase-like FAD-dependent oxidoreductase